MKHNLKSILILGSGGLRIGQAGEFDYSGSQAIKALKEEGIRVILINPNVATYQTSENLADTIYFLPITPHFIEKIIEKEKPDGILLGFGGQTALNCGIDLFKSGVLEKNNVLILGTQINSIIKTEDKGMFAAELIGIGIRVPESRPATSLPGAVKAAEEIGYPVIIRSGYSLGGQGASIVNNQKEMESAAGIALAQAPQILVEECLYGWKEVEYEVVRDKFDNCIAVCNMENLDPLGIHTGESIVVAPSQTLTDKNYHDLRDLSLKVIRHFKIVGECNIQFALDPNSDDYRVIEVNARLSRSSALASKATGYPLAFVAAKLALGYSLTELRNKITKVTSMCFEPALDYVVLKMPRWDFQKFDGCAREIGPEMKSVGEVMAIGRKFEEALQKAVRMLEIGFESVTDKIKIDNLDEELSSPTDKRIFAVAQAIREGYSVERLYSMTFIDKFFLEKIKNTVMLDEEIKKYDIESVPVFLLRRAKQFGFSDVHLAKCLKAEPEKIREKRKQLGITPVVKQIDTLAGEFPAKTNYLYFTYNGITDDITFEARKKIAVIGSGPYRIGSSVEFDWCCVSCAVAAKKLGYETIMVNCNPETVSTDYDMCDRLYFEELSFERILDINEKEKPFGFVVSMGGQTPNNLAIKIHKCGIKIIGTQPNDIDRAEDRHKFSMLLDELGVKQPQWKELTSFEDAKNFSETVGYPVLVRPSYVLSGSAMRIANNENELKEHLGKAAGVSKEHPVVITKFISGAKEIELDAVASNGEIIAHAISEHVEDAGTHSGDATIVFPVQTLKKENENLIFETGRKISSALNITGPFNIQFICNQELMVIECNLRASRSFPFVSKIMKLNLIGLSTEAMLGQPSKPEIRRTDYIGVKTPVFSFSRLKNASPVLGVEMKSTGEVASIGKNLKEAFLKSYLSAGAKLPERGILIDAGLDDIKQFAWDIEALGLMGLEIYATEEAHIALKSAGIKTKLLVSTGNPESEAERKIFSGHVDFIISTKGGSKYIKRCAADFSLPLICDANTAKLFMKSLSSQKFNELDIASWHNNY
ncbi:MAG: carbamoyl-phosphate synthase (glutamine-hydrolyzing) large subunit [DPANN group archaeon]|nr:carbamoyl-phosphate synthase (glutamine-hydrolyzing) large subunit [DPANN group archaeon]